jgi:hypothetical protein
MKGPVKSLKGRMGTGEWSRVRIVLVGVIAALLIAGAGVGVYIGIKDDTASQSDSDSPGTTASMQGEALSTEATADIYDRPEVREDIAYLKDGDIYVARLDGGGENKITARGNVTDFKPSPSGEMIAFIDVNGVLFLIDSDGRNDRQVTQPEWYTASNPAFHPDEEYLYFTCTARKDLADTSRVKVMFERYHIQEKWTEIVYARDIEDFQSICELVFDPSGKQLYFNLAGSQFPGIGSFRLNLEPQVSEELLLTEGNIPGHGYTCQLLLSISAMGDHIAIHKDSALLDHTFSRTSWIRELDSGEEILLEGEQSLHELGGITNIQFSQVDPTLYYFSKQASHDECSEFDPYCEEKEIFYTGRIGSQTQEPTCLTLTVRTNNIDGNSIWYPILMPIEAD